MLRSILNSLVVSQALVARPSSVESMALVRLAVGQAVLVTPMGAAGNGGLEIIEGVARVFCPCEETRDMTLAFLKPGDMLCTDRLCRDGVCVEALTPLAFCSHRDITDSDYSDVVNEWTFQLLRLSHIGSAEKRLQALLALLVNRLGRRCGNWYKLPFRLTHERIGELIGTTRVTTTRLISRLRTAQLLISTSTEPFVQVSPELVARSPLAT